ncbi:uncharacterized protein FOMMEDRAFT_168738 [Fomitiporia mediterranea MF3/22]|uniref:uncharacterized protein n=1 Tax=Fomitiporia mediterranea (strain MF3/22) TaxID=694068 RepID=UPI00044099FC|nr:uncharacterized protein FOMMEDRAFT_168738 [Fomitiporia mediterranea MF3/22]EJD02227.1 hypothetical protein FOMMEDRAFT_168738 [Fomitiporia mediterranea MF3/22]
MSKPRIPSTGDGYAKWKEQSVTDVHIQPFAYTFKGVELEDVYDEEDQDSGKIREVQKFIYDIQKNEVHVTYSGAIQSCIVDVFVDAFRNSIKEIQAIEGEDDSDPTYCCYTNTVSSLLQGSTDEKERYRLVGDLLIINNNSGPTFAVETCVQQSLAAIKDKVKKLFLLPSIIGILLVQVIEDNGYKKPAAHPKEDDVFLGNSWAWCNYLEDITTGLDLYDCSKPVVFDGHTWFESLTCIFEIYERDLSAKCVPTTHYEFTVPSTDTTLEITSTLESFQERLSDLWLEALDVDSPEEVEPLSLDLNRLLTQIAKNRLHVAYERYRHWYTSGSSSKHTRQTAAASSLGKRRRDDTRERLGDSRDDSSVAYWEKDIYPYLRSLRKKSHRKLWYTFGEESELPPQWPSITKKSASTGSLGSRHELGLRHLERKHTLSLRHLTILEQLCSYNGPWEQPIDSEKEVGVTTYGKDRPLNPEGLPQVESVSRPNCWHQL